MLKSELVDTAQRRESSWSHHWQLSEIIILMYSGSQKKPTELGITRQVVLRITPCVLFCCYRKPWCAHVWSTMCGSGHRVSRRGVTEGHPEKGNQHHRGHGRDPLHGKAGKTISSELTHFSNCWKPSHILWPKPNSSDSLSESRQCHCNWHITQGRWC